MENGCVVNFPCLVTTGIILLLEFEINHYFMAMSHIFLNRAAYLACILDLLAGCVHGEDLFAILSATNATLNTNSTEMTQESVRKEDERAAALRESLNYVAYVTKQREDRIRGVPAPPSQFPFPNVYGGPLHPRPNYVNFYRINDDYPSYLLCEYDIYKQGYSQVDEPTWIKAALKQIRRSGPAKFPPISWVAVVIRNVAEHKDRNTFEQSFKVGALFKASDVFNTSSNLSDMIAKAELDRHPFFFDESKPDLFPANQQRWMMVEHHAATNKSVFIKKPEVIGSKTNIGSGNSGGF